jgi:hypothetical protein
MSYAKTVTLKSQKGPQASWAIVDRQSSPPAHLVIVIGARRLVFLARRLAVYLKGVWTLLRS